MRAVILHRLKNISVISSVHASLRCWQSKFLYHRIVRYYKQKNIVNLDGDVEFSIPNEPNILFLGTDYQQDTSGMLQALSLVGRVRCFERKDGQYGLYPSSDLTLKGDAFYQNTQQLKNIVDDMDKQGCTPDVIIGQLWGGVLDVQLLDSIRRRWGTKVINIGMDDRHTYWLKGFGQRFMGSYGLVSHVDLVATAAPEAVAWYQKEGQKAVFFPEASDPSIFCSVVDQQKKYDVSFVGGCYGIRKKIVYSLREAGISVVAYGHGWENGRLATDAVPKLFAQSKIILGIGAIGHCRDFYALKLRDFDAPMSGSMYLTSENPDLFDLYVEGKEIVMYRSIDDCVNKVNYFLEHGSEREKIAAAGLLRAKHDHTWHRRFSTLFDLFKKRR